MLINKPCVVKVFSLLKAAEHCYDALLPRYKVKPRVWKSYHRNALLSKWKSDLYGNSDFWCWVFKVFKRSWKPTAEKCRLENVWFLSKYNVQSTNKMAFKRTLTSHKFLISHHQIWCAHTIVAQQMHACACKMPSCCIPVNLSIVLLLLFYLTHISLYNFWSAYFVIYRRCPPQLAFAICGQ